MSAHETSAPADWAVRFQPLVTGSEPVLDLACGNGRHARLFLDRGHSVVAVDYDISGLDDLAGDDRLTAIAADLEAGPWPFPGERFAGIVVVNYLHRPLLATLADHLAPGGVLIYQTFAAGNERFGKPRNPDFLLKPNELLEAYAGELHIVAYEHGRVDRPRPAVIQRVCAVNGPAVIPPLAPA